MEVQLLQARLQDKWGSIIQFSVIAGEQLTIEVDSKEIQTFCRALREDPEFHFEMLMDLAGVDYLEYGVSEWLTSRASETGFSRGVEKECADPGKQWNKPRFAVVYHLLSIRHNHRLRIRTFALGEPPLLPSVIEIWNSANWYEREAFDLFGILFEGHPDLRRLLTDYGFIGHPFRKDFPLIGNVEMRYSAKDERVVYEPVQIEPRTLVPKTIPQDHRYLEREQE